MSLSVGGIQFPLSNIELEQRVIVLEKTLEQVLSGNTTAINIEQFRLEAFKILQKKYPDLGLEMGGGS